MVMSSPEYANALQAWMMPYANAQHAEKMSRYMLDKFEFFGIHSPRRKELVKGFISVNGLPANELLEETVKLIWAKPQRELHYAIMEIASGKAYLSNASRIHLYEFMITTHSWWDTVDFIASNLMGPWLRRYPSETGVVTGAFMQSGNMWLQRTVLLFQLKYRHETNQELLYSAIRELSNSNEFFIRKAIGWALREYSKTNPRSVMEFVANTGLSPLSRREAMKVIMKKA